MLRRIESNRKICQLIESIKFHFNDIPIPNHDEKHRIEYTTHWIGEGTGTQYDTKYRYWVGEKYLKKGKYHFVSFKI